MVKRTLRLATAVATVVLSAPAFADELSELVLPEVTRAPWRFTEFPIIGWWGPPPATATREDYQAYKDAGFNLHLTHPSTGYYDALLHIEAVGLQSMTFLKAFEGWGTAIPNFTPPANHPAIAGFLTGDEPVNGAPMIDSIIAMNAQMQLDTTRWTFFNMLPPNLQGPGQTAAAMTSAVRNGMSVVSFDDYVIMEDGSELTEQFYANLDLVRTAAMTNEIPFWAFAVTVNHSGYAGRYRRPSESDLRWMQFSNLAYGAKGLWYFTYWGFENDPTFSKAAIVTDTGAKTELYDLVAALNQEVLAVGETLLSLESVDVVHSVPPTGQRSFVPGVDWITDIQGADVLVGFFLDHAGVQYALVVNKRHGPTSSAAAMSDVVTLTFDPAVAGVEAVSWMDGQTGALTLLQAQASLTIAGGTGVLLRAN